MDDYWTDAARPQRRNWWEFDPEISGEPPYPPIGLESFRPDPPPAIGFNVQTSAPTDPMGDFARSWLPAADEGPRDVPMEGDKKPGSTFPLAGEAAGAFTGLPPATMPEVSTAGPRVAVTA